MPYPEKLLTDDEVVVEHLHPHWITLVPAVFWFVVLCAAAGFGVALLPAAGSGRDVSLVAGLLAGVVLLVWLCVAPLLRWSSTHYVFTDRRVLIRRGVLRHSGRDISLQRISDVALSQSLWDRMVGAGSLAIESAGEHGRELLLDLPHSDRVQQALNQLIEADGERRHRGTREDS